MKRLIRTIAILCFIWLTGGCEKDTEPTWIAPKMEIQVVPQDDIKRKSAILKGNIGENDLEITECGFLYSINKTLLESKALGDKDVIKVPVEQTSGEVKVQLEELIPGTNYFYCLFITCGNTTVISPEILQFATVANNAPELDAITLRTKDNQSITVASEVISSGAESIELRGVCYVKGTEGDPKLGDNNVAVPEGETDFVVTISNLSASTDYTIRAFAMNNEGIVGYGKTTVIPRRLVDVAQDVIVREEDCGTDEGVTYPLIKPGETDVDVDLVGRCALNDIVDPQTGEVLIARDSYIESKADLEMLVEHGLKRVELRALLTCKSKYGVCQKCYGWDLSTRRPVNIGTAVGIIAAQSIGEPGTQLTMRTIHSGGVAGADDITQGLPTVARMFDVVGNVNEKILGREADLAPVSGLLRITPEQTEYLIRILDVEDNTRTIEEWRVPASARFMPGIEDGVEVRAGDQITRGFVNFRKLRKLTDIESTMHTFVESVKDVYTSQGVDLNDKHIEVIARQMLRRVQVTNPGDSQYLLGQYVDRYVFAETVRNVALAGGTPPEAEPVILGTLKVASSIDSWLSSASFIRTAGVLTEAAIEGDVDHLLDLKSNVIVGKQIPAGTGLSAYHDVELTYHGTKIDGPTSPLAKSLPEWAPDELKGIEEQLPKQLDWVGDDFGFGGVYSKNGRTLSSEEAKLYLFDDLGVSQRWTNKFSEVGIETVGDLIGKTEDDLLRIDGIGAKAIEELRDGLEARGLLYILEPEDDEADSEDLSQLLNMVFSPDADADIMLGTAAPAKHHFEDDELIGGASDDASANAGGDVINEDLGSLDDLLSQVVKSESSDEE